MQSLYFHLFLLLSFFFIGFYETELQTKGGGEDRQKGLLASDVHPNVLIRKHRRLRPVLLTGWTRYGGLKAKSRTEIGR
jgi:hypothetical protein